MTMQQDGQVGISMEDIQQLLQINPLAAEQVKTIALTRTLKEVRELLAKAEQKELAAAEKGNVTSIEKAKKP